MNAIYNGPFQSISNEYVISNTNGSVLSSGNQAIRVCGGLSGDLTGLNSTANQISIYTGNNILAAFDVNGLLISDTKSVYLGNATNYLQCSHNTTTSYLNYDTLSLKVNNNLVATLGTTNTITSSVSVGQIGTSASPYGAINPTTSAITNLYALTPASGIILDGSVTTSNSVSTTALGTNLNNVINNIVTQIMNSTINPNSIS